MDSQPPLRLAHWSDSSITGLDTGLMTDVSSLTAAEATRLAESAEAEFMFALESAAPPEAQRALRMSQARLGGGVVLVMGEDPTGGYWNKALGFGVVGRFRTAGPPAGVLQVAPSALPEAWPDLCARHGITAGQVWAKLLRPAGLDPEPATTDLAVGAVGPSDADAYARVYARGFGMPEDPHLLTMFAAAAVGAGGFTAYGAWDGDRLVAAAQLHVAGPVAAFCGAATLEEARRRGAQSAFMQRRVGDARAAGCAWLSAETWQEGGEEHNPSLHNMRRAGFVEVYDRVNWVWRP
ncbi:GCN5 family acetyltransferase [Intrasporangium calvum]|nr:GCN5 family acetyltransferase [Intrasporangium calvum]